MSLTIHSLTKQEVETNVITGDSASKDVGWILHAIVHQDGKVAFAALKLMNARVHRVSTEEFVLIKLRHMPAYVPWVSPGLIAKKILKCAMIHLAKTALYA